MKHKAEASKRSAGITVITAFLSFAAVVSLIVGMTLLFPNTWLEPMWQLNRPAHEAFQTIGRSAGFGFVFLAGIAVVAAIGFARGCRWAWWIAVVALSGNMAGDVVSLLVKRDFVRYGSGIVIAVVLLFLLFARSVRLFFGFRRDGGQ